MAYYNPYQNSNPPTNMKSNSYFADLANYNNHQNIMRSDREKYKNTTYSSDYASNYDSSNYKSSYDTSKYYSNETAEDRNKIYRQQYYNSIIDCISTTVTLLFPFISCLYIILTPAIIIGWIFLLSHFIDIGLVPLIFIPIIGIILTLIFCCFASVKAKHTCN